MISLLCFLVQWPFRCDCLEGMMCQGLREKKVSFDAYCGFMTWWVYVKVNLEYFDVMPIMAINDLWELRLYIEDLCYDVVLSMLRVVMVECSPLGTIGCFMVMYHDRVMLWNRLERFCRNVVNNERWKLPFVYE